MAKEFIVAIELGSSKIIGAAGKRNADGSFNILALAEQESASFIHKGYVYNIDKTAKAISEIVTSLSTQLKTQIKQVYVGIGGQSVRGVKNGIVREYAVNTKISQNMVYEIMDLNHATRYPEQEIQEVSVQEYKVDNQYQIDPIGIECTRFEASFLNIISRRAFFRNLNNCFMAAGVPINDFYLSPLALADVVLTEAERRSGCVLVDLGADTTSVAVFYKGILRHLAVIPLGSNNITKDIASQQIDEVDAERMKLKYACAYTESSDIDLNLKYSIDTQRSIPSSLFVEIVESRLQEILENVKSQVPEELEGKLMAGYILTGGGSMMKNLEIAMKKFIHVGHVRIAKTITDPVFMKVEGVDVKDGRLNTLWGLIAKGRENCAGAEFNPDELFNEPITPVELPAEEPIVAPVVDISESEDTEDDNRQENGKRNYINGIINFFKNIVKEDE